MIRRINAGQKIQFVPGIGINVVAPASVLGWWNAGGCPNSVWVDVWTPKGAASYSESKIGNINSIVLAEGNGSVSWSATSGWEFDGTKWLNTNQYVGAGYGMIIQFSDVTDATNVKILCGFFATDARFFLVPVAVGNPGFPNTHTYGYGSFATGSGIVTSGNLCVTSNKGYLNGVQKCTTTGTPSSSLPVTIGTGSDSPATRAIKAKVQAFGLANSGISSYVAALADAMSKL